MIITDGLKISNEALTKSSEGNGASGYSFEFFINYEFSSRSTILLMILLCH